MSRSEKFMASVVQALPDITPELARAPAAQQRKKARSVILAVILWVVAAGVLGAGGTLVFFFARAALAQQQALSISLMVSLTVPLVPGFALALYAALRNDPEAGGVLTQFATFVGAMRAALKGK